MLLFDPFHDARENLSGTQQDRGARAAQDGRLLVIVQGDFQVSPTTRESRRPIRDAARDCLSVAGHAPPDRDVGDYTRSGLHDRPGHDLIRYDMATRKGEPLHGSLLPLDPLVVLLSKLPPAYPTGR